MKRWLKNLLTDDQSCVTFFALPASSPFMDTVVMSPVPVTPTSFGYSLLAYLERIKVDKLYNFFVLCFCTCSMELSSTQADLPWEVPRERDRGPCSHEGQPHLGCRGPHLLRRRPRKSWRRPGRGCRRRRRSPRPDRRGERGRCRRWSWRRSPRAGCGPLGRRGQSRGHVSSCRLVDREFHK